MKKVVCPECGRAHACPSNPPSFDEAILKELIKHMQPERKRLSHVYVFPGKRRMVAAIGPDEQQIPELQGPWSEVKYRVLTAADAFTVWDGVTPEERGQAMTELRALGFKAPPTPWKDGDPACDRAWIHECIDRERDHQREKWGGDAHDRRHDVGDWMAFIRRRCIDDNPRLIAHKPTVRRNLLEIATLAVAAMEIYGCEEPPR